MYGYGQLEAAIDFRTIKNDLVSFYKDAKIEQRKRFKGTDYDTTDYWDMQIAFAESNAALAMDLTTLQLVLDKLTEKMLSNKKGIPETFKAFTKYVDALQAQLKQLIDAGALNKEETAQIEELYQSTEQSKERTGLWYQNRKLWIGVGGVTLLWIIYKNVANRGY